jgi:hypothetical protein
MAMIIILVQVKKLFGSDKTWEYLSFYINFLPTLLTLDVKLIPFSIFCLVPTRAITSASTVCNNSNEEDSQVSFTTVPDEQIFKQHIPVGKRGMSLWMMMMILV